MGEASKGTIDRVRRGAFVCICVASAKIRQRFLNEVDEEVQGLTRDLDREEEVALNSATQSSTTRRRRAEEGEFPPCLLMDEVHGCRVCGAARAFTTLIGCDICGSLGSLIPLRYAREHLNVEVEDLHKIERPHDNSTVEAALVELEKASRQLALDRHSVWVFLRGAFIGGNPSYEDTEEFQSRVSITSSQTACGTGAFEVSANGQLIHSKLTMGHGKCQTDQELDGILDKVQAMLT